MRVLDRRSFLIGSAAAMAVPAIGARRALGAVPSSGFVDVVVIGAGAAGIAAARRLAAAGKRFAVLEAAAAVGGRCVTDTATFGVPFDRGARWIRQPDINPLVQLGRRAGLDVYPAPPGQRLRIGRRNGREGEMEIFLASEIRASRAIAAAGHGKADMSCARALPKDLGEWRPAIDFVLGPFTCAKDLADLSAFDFARIAERDADAFCREGYGTLLAKLAEGIPVELSTPVKLIDFSNRAGVSVQTERGALNARAAIVTVSTGALASGALKFRPALPKRLTDALAKLTPGSYDHIALELAGNPLDLKSDDLVFEKAADDRTAALFANVAGTPLCLVEVGGRFGRALSAEGEAAMIDFAAEWLAGLYGNDVKAAIRRKAATRWNADPWTRGAFASAAPGGQGGRRVLMEPVGNVWFAGEAAHETLWGTVGGAWESGERAADAVLKRIAAPPPRAGKPHRRRRRRR